MRTTTYFHDHVRGFGLGAPAATRSPATPPSHPDAGRLMIEARRQRGLLMGAALAEGWRRLSRRLRQWTERARTRRELLELSDRVLLDVGLTRDEIGREAAKPFWIA